MMHQMNACAAAVIAALFVPLAHASDKPLEITAVHTYSYASGSSVCLTMTDDLEGSSQLGDLKAYVEVQDKKSRELLKVMPYVKRADLCLPGLKNGHDYSVKIKAGLLSSSGQSLQKDMSYDVKIDDAAPRVFMEKGVLLPAVQSNSVIYVQSINTERLKVALYKINRDDLISAEFSRFLSGNLDTWESTPLINNHAELQGEMTLATEGKNNEETFTALDLKELYQKKALEDGVYLLSVKDAALRADDEYDDDCRDRFFSRLLIVSNLAVTSYRGKDTMRVAVRSLKSGNPAAGAEVKVLSRSGRALFSSRADAEGFVTVPSEILNGEDALRPQAVTALLGSDFFMLPLDEYARINMDEMDSQASYDKALPSARSDLKITGFFDRGIARPGETLHYTALVRNRDLTASDLKALILKLRRTDGTVLASATAEAKGAGFFEGSFLIPTNGPRGQWFVDVFLGSVLIHSEGIQIADFTPSELCVSQKSPDKILTGGNEAAFEIDARYNYGSPAANLQADGNISFSPQSRPFDDPALSSFSFGPHEEEAASEKSFVSLPITKLDAEGKGCFKTALPKKGFAQRAEVTSTVYTASSNALSAASYIVMPQNTLIGLKYDQSASQIDALTLNSKGQREDRDISYTLKRRLNDYQFVFVNGSWRYVPNPRSISIKTAVLKGQEQQKSIDLSDLADGRYELCARTEDGGYSSLLFTKGYSYGDSYDRPDRIEITCDKEAYKTGDTVKLSFVSPREGSADLIVGSDETLFSKRFNVKKGNNEISFKADAAMGSGAHALLSMIYEVNASPVPVRSFGLTYIAVDSQDHKLNLDGEIPQNVKPGDTLRLKLKSDKLSGKMYYTAALVDEGILDLTAYQSPDPFKSLTAPSRYELKINDMCGFLLRAFSKSDQGYGADYMMLSASRSPEALQLLNQRIIALHQGATPAQDGQIEVEFKIPQFDGALRLMVTAADDTGVGSFTRTVRVRDDLVSQIAAAKILHTGDELSSALILRDSLLKDDTLTIDLSCSGSIKCDALKDQKVSLENKGALISFDTKAVKEGVGLIKYFIKAPNFKKEGAYELQVNNARTPVLMRSAVRLDPKESKELSLNAVGNNPVDAVLSIGSSPFNYDFMQERLLKTEPYDTAGEALLLNALLDVKAEAKYVTPLFEALLSRFDGSGFIETGDEYAQMLSRGALLKAKDQGYYLDENLSRSLLRTIKNSLSYSSTESAALGYEILAEHKALNLSSLRYKYDQLKDSVLPPLACASLARAFKLSGDEICAREMLQRAEKGFLELAALDKDIADARNDAERGQAMQARKSFEGSSFSSLGFDKAVIFKNAVLNGDEKAVAATDPSMLLKESDDQYVNAVLCQAGKGSKLKTQTQRINKSSLKVKNDGNDPKWYVLEAFAVPDESYKPVQNLSLTQSFLDENGKILDKNAIKVHEHLYLQLTLKRQSLSYRDTVIRAALPAGFSLERVLDTQTAASLGFKNIATPDHVENGDQGLVMTLGGDGDNAGSEVKIALALRPNVKGSFTMPSIQIYDPTLQGVQIFNSEQRLNVK